MRNNIGRAEDFEIADALVSDSDLIGFDRPAEIVEDPILTLPRKRQLLAYWASDIHAVAGSPALRTYAFGPTVPVDDILAALCRLDEMVDFGAMHQPATSGASA